MKSNHKSLIVVLLALFSIGSLAGYAEDRAGVIIYMEPPVAPLKLARPISYTSYNKTSIEYGSVTQPGGKSLEIHNEGILAVFPPPPATVGQSSASELAALEEKAKSLTGRYPNIRSAVESVMSKWRAVFQQAPKGASPASQQAATTMQTKQLIVGGVTYTGVSLEGVSDNAVRIVHADGITSIPIASLSKAQIVFLNSTSSSAHIDPDWSEKKKLADEARAKRIEEDANTASARQVTPPPRGAQGTEAPTASTTSTAPARTEEAQPPAAPEEPKPKDLTQALIYYIWSWDVGGYPGTQELHFKRDGSVQLSGGAHSGWTWAATASNKVQIQFNPTNNSTVTQVTFDASFSHFQGYSQDGRGTVGGNRKRLIAQKSFAAESAAAKAMAQRPMPDHSTPTPSNPRPISAAQQASIAKMNAQRLEQDQKTRYSQIADAANSAF